MIEITGTLNGKYYNAESVPADLLAKAFNVPPMQNGYAEFRVTPERVKPDVLNGGFQVAPSTGVPCQANISVAGKTLFMRYFTGKTAGENGQAIYTPQRIQDLKGLVLAYLDLDFEKYVYLYLHPMCLSSPAYREGNAAYYYLYDRAGEASKNVATYATLGEIGNQIVTMPEARLRIRALGLAYNNGAGRVMVDATKSVGVEELRAKLSELLFQDKMSFADAWQNDEVSLRGTVKYGIEKGVIVGRPNSSQGTEWRWSVADGGGEICVTSRNEDPTIGLLNHIAQHYSFVIPKLTEAINRVEADAVTIPGAFEDIVDSDSLTLEKVKRMAPMALVQFAASQDVLYFDRKESVLLFTKEDGETEPEPIFTVIDRSKWMEEYAAFIGEPLNVNHLKMLRQKTNERLFDKQTAIFGENGKGRGKNKK